MINYMGYTARPVGELAPDFLSLQLNLALHYARAASALREPELRAVTDMLNNLSREDNQ